MTTASRYPDGDEAPVDLFDARDGALALAVARAVVSFADQQLGEHDWRNAADALTPGRR
jgi:hypothetical protein